ncbi:uncharacterized protein LOC108631005 isoform X1 [Ceratina calcarata]|uniref:Uncharacterized protein LOC108631005 isoform X1 n=1 Tax=Ceratina calcarata TaxID=156304 RepID=A0AAJ7JDI2_9HYME|nr:uncharacterized protein LOC108631005 isoform X1 [Ceratina calcarata]
MLVLVKECVFSTCRYYGGVINRVEALKSWDLLFHNLYKVTTYRITLFSTEKCVSALESGLQKYLNRLVDAHQNEVCKDESISEILKLRDIPQLLNEKVKVTENIRSLNDLVSDDEEMKQLAKEEKEMYKEQLRDIDGRIFENIAENLGFQQYESIIMEIAPGVGGQEAMLFVKDLLDMYMSYLDHLGFDYELMELLQTEGGGIRKATLLITDGRAYEKIKYESGVHRVQRNPVTEKSGRMHTSTAVVTVCPEPKDVDVTLNEKDLKIESKKASGAGGQHVNTTNSAIRITHLPTGKFVTCQSERSQIKNKQLALKKLKILLYEDQLEAQTSFISQLRKKQMGSKLRNEKIRTYNFNQDRVTDHRISDGTMHNLKELMKDGAPLEKLVDKIYKDMQRKTILEIVEREASHCT